MIKMLLSIAFMMFSTIAYAQDVESSSVILKTPCVVGDADATCNYIVNDVNEITEVETSLDENETEAQVTLFKDITASRGLGVLVNMPRLSRNETRDMRTKLTNLVGEVANATLLAVFGSAEQGLNPIGVMGVNKAILANRIGDWQSPDNTRQPIADLIQTLRIIQAGPVDRKALLWVTSGLDISDEQITEIKALLELSRVRLGIVQLMTTDADLNRFATIAKLAQETGSFYMAKPFGVSSNEFASAQGFFDNGARIKYASEGLCGEHSAQVTIKVGETEHTMSHPLAFAACVEDAPVDDETGEETSEEAGDQETETTPVEPQEETPTPAETEDETATDDTEQPTADPAEEATDETAEDTVPATEEEEPVVTDEVVVEEKSNMPIIIAASLAGLLLVVVVIIVIRRGKKQPAGDQGDGEIHGWLRVSAGGGEHAIRADTTRIGRSVGNDIVLTESSVSAFHALIKRDSFNQLVLTDLNSTNGTHVNGEEITEMVVSNGDQIRFGSYIVSLHISGAG